MYQRGFFRGIVSIEQQIILTAQPEFAQAAIAELKQFDGHLTVIEEMVPGMVLCRTIDSNIVTRRAIKEHPIFVRHLAPVQATVDLQNNEQDLGNIALTIAELPGFTLLERGVHFAVQSRFIQTDKSKGERPYSTGMLNLALAEAFAEETGAVEDIKKPQIVVSLLCTMHTAYVGISTAEDNLSSWPGGMRHFAQTTEQISRAEFKLLEALESFGVELPREGLVLDLGAAPGGWTRLLLEAGLSVIAVDPANLDPRLAEESDLQHYRGYAEDFIEEAVKRRIVFDVIVNDMRMDARDAARLLVQANVCLHREGFIVTTFKLPHATRAMNPLTTLKEAIRILKTSYTIVQARQLFHNRQEVTAIAAQPIRKRR